MILPYLIHYQCASRIKVECRLGVRHDIGYLGVNLQMVGILVIFSYHGPGHRAGAKSPGGGSKGPNLLLIVNPECDSDKIVFPKRRANKRKNESVGIKWRCSDCACTGFQSSCMVVVTRDGKQLGSV